MLRHDKWVVINFKNYQKIWIWNELSLKIIIAKKICIISLIRISLWNWVWELRWKWEIKKTLKQQNLNYSIKIKRLIRRWLFRFKWKLIIKIGCKGD